MALMISPHNTSDQAHVSVLFNFGKSLAQELPTELVSLMANFLLQSAFEPQQPTSSAKSHCLCNLGDLLTATQVCQKWRESILNDARLWTEIEFTAQRACDVDAFTRVLGLSKELPLHIGLDFGPTVAGEAALDQLLDVSSWCASLDLKIPHELYVDLVNTLPWFPNLRRLSYTPIGNTSSEVTYEDCTLLTCIPALEHLQIHVGEAWLLPFQSNLVSLKTLEVVTKSDPRLRCGNLFFALLEQSETISNITFDVSYPRHMQWVPLRLFVNTSGSLKTLHLKRDAFRLLPDICLPGLDSLWVDTLGRTASMSARNLLPIIIDLLNRSKPPLTSFSLTPGGGTTLSAMPSMLPSMPHLQCFELHISMHGEHKYLTNFFDTLAARNDSGAFKLVPKLETLILSFSVVPKRNDTATTAVINEVDRDHFVAMVRARTAYPKSPLRLVEVIVRKNGYCNLDESDLGVLREYERRIDGLRISIQNARLRDVSPSAL